MRGTDNWGEGLLMMVRPEKFVPPSRSLRPLRTWVNDATAKMTPASRSC
jgi:hypothetical protein